MSRKIDTPEEFLRQLRRNLRKLPQEEVDQAVGFYEEFLQDAGEENMQEALAGLDSPREIAAQLRADRLFDDMEQTPPSYKKGFSAIWIVVLGIFASPIALPLAIVIAVAVLLVVLALLLVCMMVFLAVFCVVAALAAACLACILGGVAYICLGIALMFQHLTTGFFYFGTGLGAAGVGLLLLPIILLLGRLFGKMLVEVFGHRLPRLVARLFARRKKA